MATALNTNRLSDFSLRFLTSTLTPATAFVQPELAQFEHVGIAVNGKPILSTGPAFDRASEKTAHELVNSGDFILALVHCGIASFSCMRVCVTTFKGSNIDWPNTISVVASKLSGDNQTQFATNILNLSNVDILTTLLCTEASLAKILDPNCPVLVGSLMKKTCSSTS